MRTMPSSAARRAALRLVAAASVLVAAALPLAAATVTVTVEPSAEGVRVVLTHSASVAYTIQSSRRAITLQYEQPMQLQPEELRLEGPLFERCRMREPFELVIETGPDYDSFESFELQNPPRLILDLQPRGARRSRADRRERDEPGRPGTIIVIDPGHGGVEHGAVGPTGLREKDVTLALARRLRLALQQADRSVSVVLTRDEDRLVGLDERTAVANHNRADLFLSIHLNASPRSEAHGAETYYLSTDATDDEARLLAVEENRGAGAVSGTGSADPLDLVLWELAQNQHLAQSSALAEVVQRQLNQLTGTRNRGVRQAPFRVLMGAMMPAILVEVGFVSNPAEEAKLRDPAYENQVVEALVGALRGFLRDLRRYDGTAPARSGGAGAP